MVWSFGLQFHLTLFTVISYFCSRTISSRHFEHLLILYTDNTKDHTIAMMRSFTEMGVKHGFCLYSFSCSWLDSNYILTLLHMHIIKSLLSTLTEMLGRLTQGFKCF